MKKISKQIYIIRDKGGFDCGTRYNEKDAILLALKHMSPPYETPISINKYILVDEGKVDISGVNIDWKNK